VNNPGVFGYPILLQQQAKGARIFCGGKNRDALNCPQELFMFFGT